MSTRCTITVADITDTFHIYRHMDGSPADVLPDIDKARENAAWGAPRFESGDVDAAIVCTMKSKAGNIYLTREARLHDDREYHYEVSPAHNGQWIVKAFRADAKGKLHVVYYGRVKDYGQSRAA